MNHISGRMIRWGSLVAAGSAAVGIALTPPFVTAAVLAWSEEPAKLLWWDAVEALFPLQFAAPEEVYATYGRIYFLAMLPQLLGFVALAQRLRAAPAPLPRWGFRLYAAGFVLVLLGVFLDYWLALSSGFVIELVGSLLLLLGALRVGFEIRRSHALPRGSALLFWSPVLLLIPAMLLVRGHVPSGPLLPFHLMWIGLGLVLFLSTRPAAAITRSA